MNFKELQKIREPFDNVFGSQSEEQRNQITNDLYLEEFEEYNYGIANCDKVEVLDALCDMAYVLCGCSKTDFTFLGITGLEENFEAIKKYVNSANLTNVFLEAYKEVHRSNMSKVYNCKEDVKLQGFMADFSDASKKHEIDYIGQLNNIKGKKGFVVNVNGKIVKPNSFSEPNLKKFI